MNIEDDLLGFTYTHSTGSILTVDDYKRGRQGRKEYILTCSTCSADKELWPYGSITTSVSTVDNSGSPCGCRNNPSWTEAQQKIRITRYCKENNIEVISWWDEYNGNKTKLTLKKEGITKPMSINNIFSKGFQPTSKRDYEGQVAKFLATGFYPEGTIFTKSDKVNSRGCKVFWNYFCPVCDKDKYTEAGIGGGDFIIAQSSAINGWKPCRCAVSHNKTPEQREYDVLEICKEESYVFKGWLGENTNTRSKFSFVCNEGHDDEKSYKNLLRGDRCASCSKSGFDKNKPAHFYIVHWYGFGESFLKYGITNLEVISRIKVQQSKASLDHEILHTFHNKDGNVALNCEKEIKKLYKSSEKCPKKWLPDGYTETIPYTEENLENILKIAEKHFQ